MKNILERTITENNNYQGYMYADLHLHLIVGILIVSCSSPLFLHSD